MREDRNANKKGGEGETGRLISNTEFKPLLQRWCSTKREKTYHKYPKMGKISNFAAKFSVLESKTNLIN